MIVLLYRAHHATEWGMLGMVVELSCFMVQEGHFIVQCTSCQREE